MPSSPTDGVLRIADLAKCYMKCYIEMKEKKTTVASHCKSVGKLRHYRGPIRRKNAAIRFGSMT